MSVLHNSYLSPIKCSACPLGVSHSLGRWILYTEGNSRSVMRLGDGSQVTLLPGGRRCGSHAWNRQRWYLGQGSFCCPSPLSFSCIVVGHVEPWGTLWAPFCDGKVRQKRESFADISWAERGLGDAAGLSVELRAELGPNTLAWTLENSICSCSIHAWSWQLGWSEVRAAVGAGPGPPVCPEIHCECFHLKTFEDRRPKEAIV